MWYLLINCSVLPSQYAPTRLQNAQGLGNQLLKYRPQQQLANRMCIHCGLAPTSSLIHHSPQTKKDSGYVFGLKAGPSQQWAISIFHIYVQYAACISYSSRKSRYLQSESMGFDSDSVWFGKYNNCSIPTIGISS
jgi:hypothetical protein